MSEVLELHKYRKPKAKPREVHNEWYCQKCGWNAFRIREYGEIRCAACDTPIRNLRAVPR
jgi:hypothetical protein